MILRPKIHFRVESFINTNKETVGSIYPKDSIGKVESPTFFDIGGIRRLESNVSSFMNFSSSSGVSYYFFYGP